MSGEEIALTSDSPTSSGVWGRPIGNSDDLLGWHANTARRGLPAPLEILLSTGCQCDPSLDSDSYTAGNVLCSICNCSTIRGATAGFETEAGEERREQARAKTPGSRIAYAAVGCSDKRIWAVNRSLDLDPHYDFLSGMVLADRSGEA